MGTYVTTPKSTFTKSPLIHILILLILGSSLLFINLGNRPLNGSEGRWGEIAREMMITRNWINPKINAIPYRDKPVGSYWLIVLASLPGHKVTEGTTRFPTAAATLLSIFLLYLITRRFWNPETAFLITLIFMTTYPLLHWSRTANADTLTVAGMLASLYFFVKERHGAEKGTWLYPFFVAAGLTSLTKGLLGFVLPSLGVFPYLIFKKRTAILKKKFIFHFICSFLFAVILFLIPFFLDFQMTHSDASLYLVFKENIIRFFHPFDHKKPFFFYFYYIFVTLSPWSLMLPFLVWSLKKSGFKKDEGTFFFALWFICIFIFFTLSGSKRGYYILPIVAPFSALLGSAIHQSISSNKLTRTEFFLWLLPGCVAGLLGIALLLFPLTSFSKSILPAIQGFHLFFLYSSAGCLLLTSLSILMMKKRDIAKVFILIFSGFYLLMGTIFWVISPVMYSVNPFIPFLRKVNKLTYGKPIAVFRSADQSTLYFYLKETPPIPCFYSPNQAKEFLHYHKNAFLIVKGENELAMLKLKNYKAIAKEARDDSKAYLLITLPEKKGKRSKTP